MDEVILEQKTKAAERKDSTKQKSVTEGWEKLYFFVLFSRISSVKHSCTHDPTFAIHSKVQVQCFSI